MKITITIEDKDDGSICIESTPKASELVMDVANKRHTTAAHDYFFAAVSAFKELSISAKDAENVLPKEA